MGNNLYGLYSSNLYRVYSCTVQVCILVCIVTSCHEVSPIGPLAKGRFVVLILWGKIFILLLMILVALSLGECVSVVSTNS